MENIPFLRSDGTERDRVAYSCAKFEISRTPKVIKDIVKLHYTKLKLCLNGNTKMRNV